MSDKAVFDITNINKRQGNSISEEAPAANANVDDSSPVAVVAETTMPKSVTEREATIMLTSRIPVALHHRLKMHCVAHGVTMLEFTIAALEKQLAQEQPAQ